MKANARSLTMRDPALAALMGASMGGLSGSDFGDDFGFGFGDDDDDDDDDSDVGGFGANAPAPTKREVMKAWHAHKASKHHQSKRTMLLDPNKHSKVKIERYTFSLSQQFTLGVQADFDTNMSSTPDTSFRPQVLTINAPVPGFALISNIKMSNVNVSVGPGLEDAYNYSSLGWGRSLDMPTLSPSNRATLSGRYTGFIPPGYVGQTAYVLTANFKGPSLLAGGTVQI